MGKITQSHTSRPLLELLEPRRLLAAGDLDMAFGLHGIAEDPSAAHSFFVYDSLRLPGDKILVAGEMSSDNDSNAHYFLRRYNPDGSPDTTFGDIGGIIGPDIVGGQQIQNIEVDGAGHIYALTTNADTDDQDSKILRFNPDGSIDTAFGDSGAVSSLVTPTDANNSIAVQSDGKLLVLHINVISRYTTAGQLDPTFGTAGNAPNPNPGLEACLLPLANGKILIGGQKTDFAVERLNADGTLDTTFGTNGLTITNVENPGDIPSLVKALAVQSDGKILAVGDTNPGGVAVRYSADGQVDTAFGDNGLRILAGTQFNDVFLDSAGRIYLPGFVGDVVRLTPDGDLDPAFGRVFGPGGPENDEIWTHNAVLLSSGRLIVPGGTNPFGPQSRLILVARLTEDDGNPSPISVSNGTLFMVGTDEHDAFVLQEETLGDVLRPRVNDFGRIFDHAGVQRVDASGLGGGDNIDMSGVKMIPVHISGGAGRDRIAGGALKDTLEGNAQGDHIDGGEGDDLIVGNGGNDVIRGQAGNDSLGGGRGDDYLEGDDGNDHIEAGLGLDILHGDNGDDTFTSNDHAIDHLFGDAGNDSAIADDGIDILDGIEA